MIPLSARKPEQLKQKARDLLDYIRKQAAKVDLNEMAYTLQVGREAMEERLGLVVSSVEQLAGSLEAYVNGELKINSFYQGHVKRDSDALLLFSRDADLQQTVEKWMANKKFSKLLELWVKGLELDWNKLYEGETATHQPAYLSFCPRSLLDRNGSELSRCRERQADRRPNDIGRSPLAAPQYFRSERTPV